MFTKDVFLRGEVRGSKSLQFVWEKRSRRRTNEERGEGVGSLYTNAARHLL
jgi:hypothetical protein